MWRKRYPAAFLISILLISALASAGCNGRGGGKDGAEPFVIVLDTNPATLDPLDGIDASSDRLRQLMFNTLMRKNEKFEYVGDLAADYKLTDEGRTATFTLHDNVTFHDGKPLTSADAKYTFETLIASNKKKAASFFETTASGAGQPFISSIETPDPRTLVIRLRKPWVQLLGNLVSVPVIPQGSADTLAVNPVGSGAFRFVSRDESQQVVDLSAYENYWQGAPQIKSLRVRAILDANTLQAELRSGRVDIVSGASNLSPDSYKVLAQDANLKIEQFPGANVTYLGFNVESAPLNNPRLRQAIAHSVNRESIVRDLLLGQATVAHSILPEDSWAFHPGQKYGYDPPRAKQLLDEAGFPDPDGDGPRMRLPKPIVFKISSGNAAVSQYVGVIQNSLKEVGIPVEIETFETNILITKLSSGQYQLTTLRWVGGNQDPTFLRDLFHTSEVPSEKRAATRNRSRYSNPELDRILDEAFTATEREKARALYSQAQDIISRDMPTLPLWYPSVMVVARKSVGNIKIDASNDWSYVRNLTVDGR